MSSRNDRVLLATVAGSFVAVAALRLASEEEADAIAVLYVVPVGLVALRYGFRAGMAAAALAFLLFAAWAAWDDADISAAGYISRAVAYAVAAGGLSAVARRLWRHERRLQARQIHDEIVQGLVVARYSAEAGQIDECVRALDKTLAASQAIVSSGTDFSEHLGPRKRPQA